MAAKQLSITLEDDIRHRLEIEARAEERTISNMAAILIKRGLDQKAKKRTDDDNAAPANG